MATLYVAGASAEIARAEAFIVAARAIGYVVEHDWTAMVRAVGQANGAIGDDARRAAKALAYAGASTCDVFVLLLPGYAEGSEHQAHDRYGRPHFPVHTIGAWWELGVAFAVDLSRRAYDSDHDGRTFLIVGDNPERTVMTVDLPHVATDADAIEWLRERMAR